MISVVIPSRNGAATLPSLCRAVFGALQDSGYRSEIIVVLDGSEDASASLLSPLLKEGVVDRVLDCAFPTGQQGATITGILQSHGEIIITMDDDFAHPPEALEGLLEGMDRGVDLLFALPCRAGVRQAWFRQIAGYLRNLLFRLGMITSRGNNGVNSSGKLVPSSFRIFRREVALPLAAQIAAGEGCCYLSVALAAGARRIDSLPLNPLDTPSHPLPQRRYRPSSLVRLFSRLFLAVLPMPKAVRRRLCKLRFPEMEVRLAPKKILLVGGGMGQLGLARRAKKLGLELLISDRNPQAPAAALADGFLRADTFDPGETVQELRDLEVRLREMPGERAGGKGQGKEQEQGNESSGGSIAGVMTGGTDQPVLTVAAVARDFGLPGALPFETARAVTNKEVMKKRFAISDLPALPWKILFSGSSSPEDFPGIEYPAVIKPVDSQGQRGIFLVQSPERAAQLLQETLKWSRAGRAVLEPFYPGIEVTFSGWVSGGHLFPLLLTDRTSIREGEHIGICPAHRYPCSLPQNQHQEVVEICRRLVRNFEIAEGPLYVQLLSGAQGLVINEVACRIGGAYEEVLIPALVGVDILELQIDTALYGRPSAGGMGQLHRAESTWPPEGFASVILAFTGSGEVGETGADPELKALPGVVDGGYLLEPGKKIGEMENSTGRAAWGVILAERPEELNRRVELFYGTLRVIDSEGRNVVRDLREYGMYPRDQHR